MRITVLCIAASLSFVSCQIGKPPAERLRADIAVSVNNPGRVVPEAIFGSNLQWEWNGDGILSGEKWHPGILQAIADARVKTIRFPGGNLANTYRWKSGIGVRAARPAGLSFARKPAPSNFGSDELIKLCREAGLNPVITVNISATPEEAADWVDYLNSGTQNYWGKKRAANGYDKPLNVKYWEIGAEVYSPDEPGHSTATDYANRLIIFAKTMKSRDPSIKIGASLDVCFVQAAWMKSVYPHMVTWNEDVLKIAAPYIDFVSLHYYAPFDKTYDEKFLGSAVWAGPDVFVQNTEHIRRLMRKYGGGQTEITVTEYGTNFGDKRKLDGRIASTETALYLGLMLFNIMKADDIVAANHWSLLNNDVYGMFTTSSGRTLARRPTFDVFSALSEYAQGRVLPVDIKVDGYPVQPVGNIPKLSKVPYLDAVAVEKGGKLMTAVVNRSADRPIVARLSLAGAELRLGVPSVRSFYPKDKRMAETWTRNEVTRLPGQAGNVLEYEFPPNSFSIVTWLRK